MRRTNSLKRMLWLAPGVCVVLGLLLHPSVQATPGTFAAGDIFLSFNTGAVQWRNPDGTFQQVLPGTVPGAAEGMGFDSAGNLYVTHWCVSGNCFLGNTVERFNTNGASIGTFGGGYNCNPTSIRFDATGHAYVGQADCSGQLLKFGAAGETLNSFGPAPDNRGTMWIDLFDHCTVYYTSMSPHVKRFDVCANSQLSNFNTSPLQDTAISLQLLPDGGALVAAGSVILRLNAGGTLVQVYDVASEPNIWTTVGLVGDGTFWATNFVTDSVFKFDIAAGNVLAAFNAGPGATLKAVAVAPVRQPPPPTVTAGRMTGGGSVFTDADMRVTHGFQLRCADRPNNLQVDWHPIGGPSSRFHLEELTFAECTDDPTNHRK